MFLDVEPHLLVSKRLVGVQSAPRSLANSQGLVSTSSWALLPRRTCPFHLMLRYQVYSFLWLPRKILFQQIFDKFSYFLKFFREGWPSLLPFQCTQPPRWSFLSSFSGASRKCILFLKR